ncbi:hypothetical protein AQV86_00515 [Nanohaloarchaea archaeon SG9]|nr:hypothetical protein AQV86_00515 [Nanohaloarchaea archaeon SG9]
MTESEDSILFEFTEGPQDVLTFRFKEKNGKAVIDINDGDLGRLPMENLRTVEELREGLDRAEEFFKEQERRKEEL